MHGVLEEMGMRLSGDSKPYCRFPHLVKRWEEEAQHASAAEAHNRVLVQFATTEFKIGDAVWLDSLGGPEQVIIVEVQPKGYISVPRKYGNTGRLLEAVTCDVNIYRYRRASDPNKNSATGQTSEERLSRERIRRR